MAYKKKVEFNFPAALYTLMHFPDLLNNFSKAKKYSSLNQRELIIMTENPGYANGKFKLAVRQFFRSTIETNQKQLVFYLNQVTELKEKKDKQVNQFSIKIVGSGSKTKIAAELRLLAATIEGYTLEELRNGIEEENPCTVITTDVPEAYEG
jgi:hypothetical protein